MVINDTTMILEEYARNYANDPEFVAEGLAIKVTEEMLKHLEQKKLSQSWLAERMGVSRAHISRILNARPNITLLTIAKIAVALGVKPDVNLDSEPFQITWTNNSTAPIPDSFVQERSNIFTASEPEDEHSPVPEPVTA